MSIWGLSKQTQKKDQEFNNHKVTKSFNKVSETL